MFKSKKKQPEVRTPRISSRPSNVFSYHASRSRTESATGRYQEPKVARQSGNRWLYLPSYIAGFVILVSAINVLLLSSQPKVVSMAQKTPNILRDNATYEQAASVLLSRTVWNKSKLTINSDQITQGLYDQFPELDSVVVTLPLLGHRPVIQILPAQPTLIVANQSGAFVIDQHGKALMQVRELPAINQFSLPVITDDIGIVMIPGKIVLPKKTVDFIADIKEQFAAKELQIETLSLPAVANELHVRLKGHGYFLKFNLQDDARQQVGTFFAVKERLTGDNATPAEYIDVRIEGRAFYK